MTSAQPGGPAAAAPDPIRVLVADDQELVRSGFCVILEAADGITVVGEAADGAQAVAAVAAAAAGNALLAPTVTRRLIEAFVRRPPALAPSPSLLASLTARERDILLQVARGRRSAEIAV